MRRWIFVGALVAVFLAAGIMSLYVGTPKDV